MGEICDKCGQKHSRRAMKAAEAIMNGKRKISTAFGEKTVCGLACMIDFEDASKIRYAEYWFTIEELKQALRKAKIKFTDEQVAEAALFVEKEIVESILKVEAGMFVDSFLRYKNMPIEDRAEIAPELKKYSR